MFIKGLGIFATWLFIKHSIEGVLLSVLNNLGLCF